MDMAGERIATAAESLAISQEIVEIGVLYAKRERLNTRTI